MRKVETLVQRDVIAVVCQCGRVYYGIGLTQQTGLEEYVGY